MAKKEETTAVAVKEEAGLPATINYEEDAGQGFEETDSSCFAIPFLSILQALSPQCIEGKAEFDENARPGMFYNSVTRQTWKGKEGVLVIPAHFGHVFNEWAPNRGGFRGSMPPEDAYELLKQCSKNEKNQDVTPEGNILSDTRNHYVLIIGDDGNATPAVLSLTSTQLKKSKRWMSFMDSVKLPNGKTWPMFGKTYRLTSVSESNDNGTWFGMEFAPAGDVQNMQHYEAAKKFRDLVRSGAATAVPPDAGYEGDKPF